QGRLENGTVTIKSRTARANPHNLLRLLRRLAKPAAVPEWSVARDGARPRLACRLNASLAEQAHNRDHKSTDPCGQTKKQHNVVAEKRHPRPPKNQKNVGGFFFETAGPCVPKVTGVTARRPRHRPSRSR